MSISFRNIPPVNVLFRCEISDETLLVWWRRGSDTYDIACGFGLPEGYIATRLWQARERAKQDAEWNFDREAL